MLDGIVDVGAEVLFAHQVHEPGAAHRLHRLLVRMAEDELDAVLGAVVVEVLERVHAGGVERGHAAHADDQVLREGLHRDVGDAVGDVIDGDAETR